MQRVKKKNHTFFLPEDLLEKYRAFSSMDYIPSMNEGVRIALEEYAKRLEKKLLYDQMKDASEDEMFMEDLENTMKAFREVDKEIVEGLD